MTIPQRISRRIPRRFHCREPALCLLVGGVVAVAGQLLLWWLMGRGLSPGPANAAVVATTLQLNFLGNRALTPSPGAYLEWIERVNSGLGTTKAAIVIEPDAVPADCYSPERGKLLREAVHRLAAAGHFTYLDAGRPRWKSTGEAAERLMAAGIQEAQGFSVNVSNRQPTAEADRWGLELSDLVGEREFVIDTSRNGAGPPPGNDWCNPLSPGIRRQAERGDGPARRRPAVGQTARRVGRIVRRRDHLRVRAAAGGGPRGQHAVGTGTVAKTGRYVKVKPCRMGMSTAG